jgi:outer membrane protein TolC
MVATGVLAGSGLAHAQAQLTLEQTVGLTLERDERARIADQELRAAEAQTARARAFFFPDVTASGSYTFRGNPGEFQDRNVLTGALTLGVTLLDLRGVPLYRTATLQRDAQRLERIETRRVLAFEAADAYLATLGQQAVVEAAQHRLDFARENLADARGRVAAQLASSNDATRAELELATAERELRRAEGDLDAARLALGWLLATDVSGPLAQPEALLGAAASPAGDPAVLVTEAQSRRLDLAASQHRVQAARAFAREPLQRWWPTFNLTGQTRYSSEEGFTGKNTDWSVSVNAVWQLWDGGERSAERSERLAQAEVSELRRQQEARSVALQVRTALSALERARGTVAQAEAAVVAARRNVEETRTLYKQGLARALEVSDASARLFEAEVALARERYGLALAMLDLRAALGLDPAGQEVRS